MALAALGLASCQKNNSLAIDDAVARKAELAHAESGKVPVANFDNLIHDFGTIKEGIKVEHTYTVTNAGKGDLVISNAKPSCGCTVPDWTKTPIKPGETGQVKVIFDSSHKSGNVEKTVALTLNTEKGTETLNFKANVEGGAKSGVIAH
ncbi:Protein of unknown function [Flavobacterium akiainvivens]|nr:Protein of unknown function [Flavobacterium akiainvivens]